MHGAFLFLFSFMTQGAFQFFNSNMSTVASCLISSFLFIIKLQIFITGYSMILEYSAHSFDSSFNLFQIFHQFKMQLRGFCLKPTLSKLRVFNKVKDILTLFVHLNELKIFDRVFKSKTTWQEQQYITIYIKSEKYLKILGHSRFLPEM